MSSRHVLTISHDLDVESQYVVSLHHLSCFDDDLRIHYHVSRVLGIHRRIDNVRLRLRLRLRLPANIYRLFHVNLNF